MKTTADPAQTGRSLDAATEALRRGGLVVYATDTLYGLGARVDDPATIRRVFDAKQRPRDQPLSLALKGTAEITHYAHLTPLAHRLSSLLPGPLTLLLRKRVSVPSILTGGAGSVAVRVPDHPQALALLERAGPLTATSANVHGQPDPESLEACRAALGDRVDYYLEPSSPPRGVPSTLVDARGTEPKILREGVLSEARIRAAVRD